MSWVLLWENWMKESRQRFCGRHPELMVVGLVTNGEFGLPAVAPSSRSKQELGQRCLRKKR